MAMMEKGMTQAEARNKIWMYDKHGLLVKVSLFDKDINNQNICHMPVWLTAWLTV